MLFSPLCVAIGGGSVEVVGEKITLPVPSTISNAWKNATDNVEGDSQAVYFHDDRPVSSVGTGTL
jgi:hypothetical protein